MELGIEGKVALVGGASRGLGRAVAEELAGEGAHLVLCARGRESLEDAAQALDPLGAGRVVSAPADLSTPEGIDTVLAAANEAFGRVDILVTNTGGPPAGPFESHEPERWREAYQGLLESVVRLVRGVLPGMRQRRWGRIVNITSIAVKQPVDGLILSNSIRAAVTGLAKTLANEVAAEGITVNCVMPGYTRTDRLVELADRAAEREGIEPAAVFARWEEQTPMGRVGEPRELAALVAFLASERAGYITGTSIPVDGGWIRALV